MNGTGERSPAQALQVRLPVLLGCLVAVFACLAYAWTRNSMPEGWVRDHGGGAPYVAFWALLAGVVWPKKSLALRIALAAILVTCGVEFIQLYNPEPLASFRKTKFGAALLGSSFSWADMPPYFIGGLIGWLALRKLSRN